MRINTLVADGVRNLQTLQLAPRERFNVFVGDNGQGKTSLLEAIYVVATLRSFRTTRLSDLIAFGRPEARLGARVVKNDLVRVYEVDLAPGARKVRLDGKAPRPLSRYFGGFNVVVFTPEDLALPRGSPGDRRRFLDRGVFNFDPSYLALATDYDKVLRSRNAVLKQAGQGILGGTKLEDMLLVYDVQLARLAVQIVRARVRFLASLRPALVETFSRITRTGLVAGARYVSRVAEMTSRVENAGVETSRVENAGVENTRVENTRVETSRVENAGVENTRVENTRVENTRVENAGVENTRVENTRVENTRVEENELVVALVEQKLRENRVKDLATQSTQLGPHRDDVVLELDGREAGSFASQGQLRAIMLAWKTAELRVLGEAHGDQPILLLDDVSSELDPTRNEFLFDHLATLAGQCFITTTHGGHVLLAQNRADYRIQGGQILQ
ncbi:MAG: DNA replication/repair protein RecF [Kofleriaceae bacterium]